MNLNNQSDSLQCHLKQRGITSYINTKTIKKLYHNLYKIDATLDIFLPNIKESIDCSSYCINKTLHRIKGKRKVTSLIERERHYSEGSFTDFPFSLSLAIACFMASFLFLLANTFACTPLTFGSFFSSGGGGGGLRAAAFAFLSPMMFKPSTAPAKPNVTFLHHANEPIAQNS